MRLDRVVTDIKRTVERILIALSNELTVEENLGPSGAPEGHVITSTGPTTIPAWRANVASGAGVKGDKGDPGNDGAPGTPGADGSPVDVTSQFDKIMTADYGAGTELVFDHVGNVMYIE